MVFCVELLPFFLHGENIDYHCLMSGVVVGYSSCSPFNPLFRSDLSTRMSNLLQRSHVSLDIWGTRDALIFRRVTAYARLLWVSHDMYIYIYTQAWHVGLLTKCTRKYVSTKNQTICQKKLIMRRYFWLWPGKFSWIIWCLWWSSICSCTFNAKSASQVSIWHKQRVWPSTINYSQCFYNMV